MEERAYAAYRKFVRHRMYEKALDVLNLELSDEALTVTVTECPAVKHLKATGREVSPWYRYTTQVVMEVLAEAGGFGFQMEFYDEETGAAKYLILRVER